MDAVETRFWAKVDKTPECWLWTGGTIRGYGSFSLQGRSYYAHRWAYERLVGPVPPGCELDHLCRTPRCVNPAHLDAVPHAENIRRGMAVADRSAWHVTNQNSGKTHCVHGHPFDAANTVWSGGSRHCRACRRQWSHARVERRRKGTGPAKGERIRTAKLTADAVAQLRARYAAGESIGLLAREYGVTPSNVWCIVTRKTWKHID